LGGFILFALNVGLMKPQRRSSPGMGKEQTEGSKKLDLDNPYPYPII
jgi:hypothetical protein